MQTGRITQNYFFPFRISKNYPTIKEVFPDTAEIDHQNLAGIADALEISMTTIPHHPDRGHAESKISDYTNGVTRAATEI